MQTRISSDIGPPVLPGPRAAYSRLCVVFASHRTPVISAIHPETSGDLRGIFALELGLRIDQVRIWTLTPGGFYSIGDLWQAAMSRARVLDATVWLDG